MRILYSCLLRLHPPAFRRGFGAEMLWLFDETKNSDSSLLLCLDCFTSLLRQWVSRFGSWKVPLALTGACVEFTLGGLIWIVFRNDGHPQKSVSIGNGNALDNLIRLIVYAGCGIVGMVAAASAWITSFVRQRALRLRTRR
ncbi:MAG: hypothetical protein JOY53_15560 [Acidobacteriaceae bacterium]|nr:hypothetical protein [Acidobacteriaceae bacterium]